MPVRTLALVLLSRGFGVGVSCSPADQTVENFAFNSAVGISTVEVSGKFAPHKKETSTDLGPEMWEMLKKVLENVKARLNKGKSRTEWWPILYGYELYRGAAESPMDFGQLVFTNGTLSKFLLVNVYDEPACKCGNPYHGDYSASECNAFYRLVELYLPSPLCPTQS
jgi:hypothetical protein